MNGDTLTELTQIRRGSGTWHEKAQRFVQVLREAGTEEVVLMTCDVCEEDLHTGHYEIFFRLCQELDPDTQMDEICRRLDEQTPEETFVRVQAETGQGYLTFCFFCDSTMCGNEVEYPDSPDWDGLQKERALRYLELHPEWNGIGIMMSGSTRYRVVFDLLVPAGQRDPQFVTDEFEGHFVQISFTPEDYQMLRLHPKIRGIYEPVKS